MHSMEPQKKLETKLKRQKALEQSIENHYVSFQSKQKRPINLGEGLDIGLWGLLTLYAERLPIGLERVIQTISADTVKQFYGKWYHLHNMVVIAVGDFFDTQSVVELIRTHFGDKSSSPDPPLIPFFPVPSHEEPRFSCFVESEATGSAVMISCKMPADELKIVKDYRNLLAESMFFHALNQRFFKISRRKDSAYFSCSAVADVVARPVKAYIMTSFCKEKGTIIEALKSILTEVARVRLHGFSKCEISVARALLMSEIESTYLERDQMQVYCHLWSCCAVKFSEAI